MKETELAEKFISYFDKFEIYKEVPGYGGIIDFVAKSGKCIIAVEVKLSLNFNVIEQAYKNRAVSTYSYVAVPRPKHESFAYDICQKLGIGVLTYSDHFDNVLETVKPIPVRHKKQLIKLEPYMQRSIAGSQNLRITAFKNTIENMELYIRRHPGCSLKDCLTNVSYHWSNLSSAKKCVYQWMQKGIITSFKMENSKLYLTDKANQS